MTQDMTSTAIEAEIEPQIPAISFPRKDIMNIFQLGSQDEDNTYFLACGMKDIDRDTLYIIHSTLRDMHSPEAVHFEKKSALKNMDMYLAAEEGGCLFMWVDYNLKNETEPDLLCRSALLVVDIPTAIDKNAKIDRVTIHQLITGFNFAKDGTLIFRPNEVFSLCLPDDCEENIYAEARRHRNVTSSFCYAESALRSILAGLPLDMEWNQEWLFDSNGPIAHDQFQYLLQRTPEEFTMDIYNLQQEALEEEAPQNQVTTIPPPGPTLQ
ncbi:MAG TPA: hypothetical protein PKI93_05890 [Alphaproteobacteria bacterium]|nr:hypothetical protein [Alphaproteobacteria bacterium]HNS44742.1 hypothetical protein [Alphaproteobacteria bacterium]